MPDRQGQRLTAARIGLMQRVVGVRRAQAPQGEPPPQRAAEPVPAAAIDDAEPDDDRECDRVARLEARIGHLEAELEALQDAVHRGAVREDERFDLLSRQIEPATLARALSEDARRRGL